MRKIFIGDIHGMLPELRKLMEAIQPLRDDEIIFVGDLVDKGPDSAETVKWVRKFSKNHNVVLVTGNHEAKHAKFRKKLFSGDEKGAMALKNSQELLEITEGLDAEDIRFLDSSILYHVTGEYLVVHGGIPRGLKKLPKIEVTATLPNKERKFYELMTMVRYLDKKTGEMLPLGAWKEGDPYWAEEYDGRFGRVIFGHEAFLEGPKEYLHAVGIDTGAVYGGRLTALVVSSVGEEYISVPSRKFKDRIEF